MNKKVLFYIILIILLIFAAATAFLFYNHMSKTEEETKITEPYSTETELADILSNRAKERRDEILQGPYGQMSPKELVEATIEMTSPEKRWMTVAIMIRKTETLPVIKEKLLTGSDTERYKLVMMIRHSLRWPETIPILEEIIQSDSISEIVRARAATALARFEHKEAISDIRDFFDIAEDGQSKQLAAMALAFLGDSESQERFKNMLQDSSSFIQIAGAMCLGIIGDNTGLETVIDLSLDGSISAQVRAIEALSYIDSPEAIARLSEMSENDSSSLVRQESVNYLDRAELAKMKKEEALVELKSTLSLDRFSYLVNHYGNEALDFLQELSESPGPFQEAAIIALFEIDSGVVTISEIRRRDR